LLRAAMARRVALALLAACAAPASSRLARASRAWADVMPGVEDPWSGAVAVRALLAPLTAATIVSYTGNTSEAVAGFELLASWQPQESLHAVAYVSQDGARLLVALRGTTSAADRCADDLLFSPGLPQRKASALRAPSDLDYTGRAAAVVEQSRRLAPAALDVVLTGHSLGCALAQVQVLRLAASGVQPPSARALCFAPAGTRAQRLGGLDPSGERAHTIASSPWDPVQRPVGAAAGGQQQQQHISRRTAAAGTAAIALAALEALAALAALEALAAAGLAAAAAALGARARQGARKMVSAAASWCCLRGWWWWLLLGQDLC
jgi:hypothetical protein